MISCLQDFLLLIKYLIIHIFTCIQQWVSINKINKAILEQPEPGPSSF